MSLDPGMHFGRPSSTAVRRLDLPRLVSTHHQYPRTPSPLPAPLQHNCASHYPANELTAHENILRIYHRTSGKEKMAAGNTGFLQQDARRGQDGTKIAASELVTTIRSRQGPSLDNREAGRSQPETTQILVANQTQRCRSKERARPKDQHAKRPIT